MGSGTRDKAIGADTVRAAGHWLHLIRAVEEAGRRLYLQGQLPGSFYDGRGQEATAVGAALAMADDDVAVPLIRDMGVHLVRGVTPAEMLRHYLGKAGAPTEGADGNIHLGAYDRGTIPMISHLPEMLPVALGVAVARRRRGVAAAALGFCGDGASCGGVFHETLNLAAVWNAPFVVVVERNGYAYMTPEQAYLSVPELRARAEGYGIGSAAVDGNDVIAVYDVVKDALDHARAGAGPFLIEARTYRMHGHGAHDGAAYMPADELERWLERDPLAIWRRHAEDRIGWTADAQADLEQRVADEVATALADAREAPFPPAENLAARVFA
jgi:TPP-dependent pyruvate/acetoin dehydrogenase alpha subunit